VDVPLAHSAEKLVHDNSEDKKPPANPFPNETNGNCKRPPADYRPCEAQAEISEQNDDILTKGNSTSDTETDDSLPEDGSIAGLVAQDMERVLPPLCVEPSPSWDPDASMLGKFDATTLPITSPACPWPSSLQIFTSPMDNDFESRIDTPQSGGVDTGLQGETHSYFAHV
jgi:hypothetical protein